MKYVCKKAITILFIILFVSRFFMPLAAYADDPTPTPTPDATTPTPTQTVTPTPDSSNSPTATPTPTATTTPTPTPDPTTTPTSTPSDTPTPTITPTPDSVLTASDSATPTPIPSVTSSNTPSVNSGNSSSTTTGNATSVTQAQNDVNTTSINSQAVNQTINIFLPQNNNVDLSDPSKIAADVVSNNTKDGEVFNISIVDNNAYVNTDVISIANTGDNTATGAGEFAINTGNATSLVQLVNKVNLTLVNSAIHFVTINIYGTLNGNIILPTPTSGQDTPTSVPTAFQTNLTNQATVTNAVTSTANTGSNAATTNAGNASVTTGNANAQINIINLINELIFGVSFNYLVINDLGTWNGNFLGWGDLPATTGSKSLEISPSITPSGGNNTYQSTSAQNTATVTNNISSLANTGYNAITTSSGNGMIITGNAQSIVSLINLINSVFINSNSYFMFVNIFGTLNGDIGDASKFITPTPQPSTDSSSGVSHKEDGVQLTLTNTNNTGAYVLPGDTVTFFFTVHNPGTGKVYGTHLHLSLLKDGVEQGATDYDLGDLDAGKSIRITTGLVLSTNAPSGTYTAHAVVTGTTGDENTSLQADADSVFHIFAPSTLANTGTNHLPKLPVKTVLAAHTPNENANSDNFMLFILGGVVGAYLTIRVIKDRQHLLYAFTQNQSLTQRLHSLRLFLL